MKFVNLRSHCPINFALETFGDSWSLLIIRDIVFWGKQSFKEFSQSEEGIASNILAIRLAHLVKKGILLKKTDPGDKRKTIYQLTDKGLDLIPMLLEMCNWASYYDTKTIAPKKFVSYVYSHRKKMFPYIRQTVLAGGSLFGSDNNVLKKLSL